MATARHLVVVAGADPAETDTLAAELRDAVAVRTAYSVDGLLASLDHEVDAVLVDPDLSGFSVSSSLTRIRAGTADCQVGLLTDEPLDAERAVSEGIDACLGRHDDEIREVVEWLAIRAQYRKRLDEYYATAQEYAQLSVEDGSPGEVESVEAALLRLERRLEALCSDLRAACERLDGESVFDAALSERNSGE